MDKSLIILKGKTVESYVVAVSHIGRQRSTPDERLHEVLFTELGYVTGYRTRRHCRGRPETYISMISSQLKNSQLKINNVNFYHSNKYSIHIIA